jgi:hypothetical protein
MRQQPDSSPTRDNPALNPQNRSTVDAISQFKIAERSRWKKRVLSFIFVGALISLLVHINLGFLLSFLLRGRYEDHSEVVTTTIEFALEDSEALNEIPEGQLLKHKSVRTEATSDSLVSTQASLTADVSMSSLSASTQTMTPSLAGGGGGLGGGLGGSGGGTSFFGISSSGSSFCYILDISGSMNQQGRLESAKKELYASLKKLPDFSRFYILFYNNRIQEPARQKGWNTARASTVKRMAEEIESLKAGGGTIPAPAFEQAFMLDPLPEVIFFLTDGQIRGFDAEVLRLLMPKKSRVVVNAIAFGHSANQDVMKAIATMTGGQYKFVQPKGAP